MPKIIEDVEIKIANISLAFNNPKLLNLLIKRGALITKGKISEVPKINKEIEKYINKDKNELIRAVAAFITFDRLEGKYRAIEYFKKPETSKKKKEGEQPLV